VSFSTTVQATAVATAVSTESTVLVIPPVGGPSANVSSANVPGGNLIKNAIFVDLNITAGASTTAIVVRCRQTQAIGGALVDLARTITLAAGSTYDGTLIFRDPAGVVGGAYNITVQQTAGTVAGTVNVINATVNDYV
jgi:hypothetical protein